MVINYQSQAAAPRPLYTIFTAIPPHYDLINRLITLGMDRGWRHQTALKCLAARPLKLLDLCCGTGDLAINAAVMAQHVIQITGFDYSQPMLDLAAKKSATLTGKSISFTRGEVAQLPFTDAYFDCIGVSFAFRNLTYKNPLAEKHLAEIIRVLKPGGRCIIAESSQPDSRFIRAIYHFYLHRYVYPVGAFLSGNKGAYRYLAESATNYYSPARLKELLLSAGFATVEYRPLFFGAAGIYLAVK